MNASAPSLPLLYSSVEVLDRQRHVTLRLTTPSAPFAFARAAHMMPALIAEFVDASRDLPILFADDGADVTPIFLVGVEPGVGSLIDAAGQWIGRYMPAYLRRYPFIGADVGKGEQVVCADLGSEALCVDKGDPLFEADGTPTAVLERATAFVAQYASAAEATQTFTRDLKALGLFRQVDVTIRSSGSHSASFHGLLAIDEEKLATLEDAAFGDLRRKGYLPAIYAHLASLGNLARLGEQAGLHGDMSQAA